MINLEDVQATRTLHCDNNIPKLYLEHVDRTELNASNAEILVNLQSYVSPTDTTHVLSTKPSIFDESYIATKGLEPKTEPDLQHNLNCTITESMGSALGEVMFPAPIVKHEHADNLKDLITQHSPQCELHMHITNIVSLQHPNESPASTENYSTDSTIIGGVCTPQAHLLLNLSLSVASSQDVTVPPLQDVTYDTLQAQSTMDKPWSMSGSQDLTISTLQDVTNGRPSPQNLASSISGSQDITTQSLQDVTHGTPQHVFNVIPDMTEPSTLIGMDDTLINGTVSATALSEGQKNTSLSLQDITAIDVSLASQDIMAIDHKLLTFTSRLQDATNDRYTA